LCEAMGPVFNPVFCGDFRDGKSVSDGKLVLSHPPKRPVTDILWVCTVWRYNVTVG
jgi:hypothetical protein